MGRQYITREEKNFFLIKYMNKNCLDLILGTLDRNCCIMENVRGLDDAVNETF